MEGDVERQESLATKILSGVLDTLFSAAFFVEEHPLSSVFAAFLAGVAATLLVLS